MHRDGDIPPSCKILYFPSISPSMIQEVDLVEVADVHGIGKDPTADELLCWLRVIAHGKPVVAAGSLSAATRPGGRSVSSTLEPLRSRRTSSCRLASRGSILP